MNVESQIMNWLKVGISQSPSSMNESFYFDKLKNEFFSILFTDYFMLDEDLNVAENTTTSYSTTDQSKLISNIKRIENQDTSLILIPRLSNEERQDLLKAFIKTIDNQKERTHLTTSYLKSEQTIFDLRFEIEGSEQSVNQWNLIKDEFLLSKAESFLNLNNIHIDQSYIWIPNEEGNITIDLKKNDDGAPLEKKSRWWEFWK